MKHIEIEKKETEILKDVTCDICGGSCKTEYMTMYSNWGFSSNKDMEKWEAQICESCVDSCFGMVKFQKSSVFSD